TIPYPDTTRAELEAIISFLFATPNNTHIHIHLDNKTAIKNLKQKYYTKPLQNQNCDILLTINQIKSIKNLTFTLHK
ncbi:17443_t:CDS:1, partial [Racocetra persica]